MYLIFIFIFIFILSPGYNDHQSRLWWDTPACERTIPPQLVEGGLGILTVRDNKTAESNRIPKYTLIFIYEKKMQQRNRY